MAQAVTQQPETLVLDGGRALAYAHWGDARGYPVIHAHGTPGSRLERYPDEATLTSLGIRLVTFDRPGYGFSDPLPGRTLLDVAADLSRLAEHLGIGEFAVTGMSGGAPFALATAAALGERVSGVAILAGLGPLDREGAFDGMDETNAAEFRLARDDPDELPGWLEGTDLASVLPQSELAVLGSIPGLAEILLEGAAEPTRRGWAGVIADDLAFAGAWGFALDDIAVPLSVWHGEEDPFLPLHHAQHVAARVPGARLHAVPGEGHLAMFGHTAEALRELVAGR
jgi:pimeloyl-ACP methyl ester carboxylesterase